MKTNQLTRGESRRVMYVENKDGDIDGPAARIGWLTFSRSGRSVRYRGRELLRAKGGRGNYIDIASRDQYWVSGIKCAGRMRTGRSRCRSRSMPTLEEYELLRSCAPRKQGNT